MQHKGITWDYFDGIYYALHEKINNIINYDIDIPAYRTSELYQNTSNYVSLSGVFQPFGNFMLNPNYYIDPTQSTKIHLQIHSDPTTGFSILYHVSDDLTEIWETLATCSVGYTVLFSQIVTNASAYQRQTNNMIFNTVYGATQSVGTAAINSVDNTLHSKTYTDGTQLITDLASNLVQDVKQPLISAGWSVGRLIHDISPKNREPIQVNSISGGAASSKIISTSIQISAIRNWEAPIDRARFGSPLEENRLLSTLSGFANVTLPMSQHLAMAKICYYQSKDKLKVYLNLDFI